MHKWQHVGQSFARAGLCQNECRHTFLCEDAPVFGSGTNGKGTSGNHTCAFQPGVHQHWHRQILYTRWNLGKPRQTQDFNR